MEIRVEFWHHATAFNGYKMVSIKVNGNFKGIRLGIEKLYQGLNLQL